MVLSALSFLGESLNSATSRPLPHPLCRKTREMQITFHIPRIDPGLLEAGGPLGEDERAPSRCTTSAPLRTMIRGYICITDTQERMYTITIRINPL